MSRIHALRRQQRIDVVAEIPGHFLPLFLAQGLILDNPNLLPREQVEQFPLHGLLLGQNVADDCIALINLFLWGATVIREQLDAGAYLLLEATDPLHEKLVQVGADH